MNDFDFTATSTQTKPRKYHKPQRSGSRWLLLVPALLLLVIGYSLWSDNRDRVNQKSEEQHRERIKKIDDDLDEVYRKAGRSESFITQKRMLRVTERGTK